MGRRGNGRPLNGCQRAGRFATVLSLVVGAHLRRFLQHNVETDASVWGVVRSGAAIGRVLNQHHLPIGDDEY
jgi:hypothetical protein